ncbi:MAG: polymer-forming cytoskeletal protein [Planctomycetota bacterium]|nr:polymer-forming cytoskeletal protein [Planctomycetota bacterium]
MIDKTSGAAGESATVIGADAKFKGELSFTKGVRVDGVVEGRITAKGLLTISQGGKLKAEVEAGNIIVDGEVTGNLKAVDRIQLRKSGRLRGDLRAAKLLVEEGASFVGNCHVGPDLPSTTDPTAVNRMTGKEALPRK